jgi:hypothetical protein
LKKNVFVGPGGIGAPGKEKMCIELNAAYGSPEALWYNIETSRPNEEKRGNARLCDLLDQPGCTDYATWYLGQQGGKV